MMIEGAPASGGELECCVNRNKSIAAISWHINNDM
jgi:hypothetical protein